MKKKNFTIFYVQSIKYIVFKICLKADMNS